jgi:pimeloyl-ACP methyl ester carboxylesterase
MSLNSFEGSFVSGMKEDYIELEDGWFSVRHSGLHQGLPTLLFIHGLGESGLCFNEAFDFPEMKAFNLIVPDMLGYGRSSASGDSLITLVLNPSAS